MLDKNGKQPILIAAGLAVVLLLVSSCTAILFEDGGKIWEFTTLRGETVTIYGGNGVYQYDSVEKAVVFRSVNWVDLLVGIPLLLLGVWLVLRGRLAGMLLLSMMFGYLAYFYLIGAMGNAFNGLFLVWIAISSVGMVGLMLVRRLVDHSGLAEKLQRAIPQKFFAVYLFALAIVLTGQYLAMILSAYALGAPPAALGHYTTMELAALELGIMIPLHFTGGMLILRKRAAGYILAVVLVGMAAMAFLSLSMSQALLYAQYQQGSVPDLVLVFCIALVTMGFSVSLFRRVWVSTWAT